MNKINEISRKSMFHEEKGIACGLVNNTAIMAEIVVEMDGQNVFLYGEWVDLTGDYSFEAYKESLFDANKKVFNASGDDWEKAITERDLVFPARIKDDSIFEPYYAELKQMIHNEMKANGFDSFPEDED